MKMQLFGESSLWLPNCNKLYVCMYVKNQRSSSRFNTLNLVLRALSGACQKSSRLSRSTIPFLIGNVWSLYVRLN